MSHRPTNAQSLFIKHKQTCQTALQQNKTDKHSKDSEHCEFQAVKQHEFDVHCLHKCTFETNNTYTNYHDQRTSFYELSLGFIKIATGNRKQSNSNLTTSSHYITRVVTCRLLVLYHVLISKACRFTSIYNKRASGPGGAVTIAWFKTQKNTVMKTMKPDRLVLKLSSWGSQQSQAYRICFL